MAPSENAIKIRCCFILWEGYSLLKYSGNSLFVIRFQRQGTVRSSSVLFFLEGASVRRYCSALTDGLRAFLGFALFVHFLLAQGLFRLQHFCFDVALAHHRFVWLMRLLYRSVSFSSILFMMSCIICVGWRLPLSPYISCICLRIISCSAAILAKSCRSFPALSCPVAGAFLAARRVWVALVCPVASA